MTMVSADGESTRSLIGAGRMGSLERAIEGDYELSIRDILSEAWDRTSGVKGQFWTALLYLVGLYCVVRAAGSVWSELLGNSFTGPLFKVSLNLAFHQFAGPVLLAGFTMMGVHRASDKPVESRTVFTYFHTPIPLILANVLVFGLTTLGFLLFIVPGVYLLIAYSYVPLLIVDKGLTPWEALETSRKAVTKHWFKFFSLGLVMIGLIAVSGLPLGIGLIWTIPWSNIVHGVTYRTVFGVSTQESEPR